MVDLDGVDSIIFDLGGVILNIDYELTSQAFKAIGFKEFDVFYSQKEQSRLFDLFEIGAMDSHQFLTELSTHVSDASISDLKNAWNAMLLDLPKHRLEIIQELKKGFGVYLLSNTNEIHEKAFIEIVEREFGYNALETVFDKVYLSHRIGYRKPNADCFRYVITDAQLDPDRTLFIDDSIQHVHGARALGIKEFHLEKGKDISQIFPDKFQSGHH